MNKSPTPAFTGALLDPITAGTPLGNGYRWYLPALMRFNTPDSFSPFGAGGANPYAYCGGDPINRIDPTGHFNFAAYGDVLKASVTRALQSAEDHPLSVTRSIEPTHDAHAFESEQHVEPTPEPSNKRTLTTAEPRVKRTLMAQKKAQSLPAVLVEEEEVVVMTLEGRTTAKRGSYILTGVQGEKWGVPDEDFKRRYTYDPETGRATPIPTLVFAEEMEGRFQVRPSWSKDDLTGNPGDFRVTPAAEPGNSWIVEHEIFFMTYDIVPD